LARLRPGLAAELIELFRESVPVRLSAFDQALARDDLGGLVEVAHALKGEASAVGARQLAELCSQLEQYGRQGATAKTRALLAELTPTCERTLAAFAR
jgi:HPt (histidine-containing phosphotransfer) domain-containing protein